MIIADEDQLLGVCWNVSAVGGSGLGPDVHSFAVRPVGPVVSVVVGITIHCDKVTFVAKPLGQTMEETSILFL